MRQDLSLRLEQFKKQYVADEAVRSRIAEPPVKFIGDEIMELALEEKPIPEDMIRRALRKGTIENLLVPVTCGTSYRNKGVQKLLDAIVDFMPSRHRRGGRASRRRQRALLRPGL